MNPPEGKIAAFFDFDRTLLTTDSAGLGLRYLFEHGLVDFGYILKALAANVFYKRHLISEPQMARLLLPFYEGKRLAPFEDGVCEFYEDRVKPRYAGNILARLREHQEAGHVTVLVSGSVRYSLLPVIRDLGIPHLLCTELEVGPDGLLTGRTQGPLCIGEAKAVLARELAETEGIDLCRSFAYGNHQNDIPMLEMVGHAFAVEPTAPLRRAARARGWPVLSF